MERKVPRPRQTDAAQMTLECQARGMKRARGVDRGKRNGELWDVMETDREKIGKGKRDLQGRFDRSV